MTATEGGTALQGAPEGAAGEPGAVAHRPAPRLRTVLVLAKAEASLLTRSALVLLGLVAGGAVIWVFLSALEPLWWNTAWEIGSGQLILGATVLMAAQLAAGRARRDGMTGLYASFPATAGTRTAGQLLGLAGALPASLLLIGASVVTVHVIGGAIGVPSITVLAGGLLLVIASGAVGMAIGTRFAHPLAGVLAALALFLVSAQAYRFSAATTWLVPWDFKQDTLDVLPGPLAGYPPAGAHAVELAAIAVLAVTVALLLTVHRRARPVLAAVGILAAALICLVGAVQLRPIPASAMGRMVAQSANPASVQHCTTSNRVRYCLDASFSSLQPSLAAPVNGVLAHVPVRPDRGLTVSQVGELVLDPTLTQGYPREQVARWDTQLRRSPAVTSPAAAIYLPIGAWPAFGGRLADARFNVALATADWAVHIPLASESELACVPVDQAREAIAIWLAILATHPSVGALQAGLQGGSAETEVANTFVPTWTYPGANYGQVDEVAGVPPQDTEAGYLLARAMASMPEQKVERVLTADWTRWVNARTIDAQLAAALGIRMPSVHVPQLPPGGTHSGATPPAGNTQNPVCTT